MCLTLCNPMGYSSPGFSIHGILQARILEWGSHSLLQGIFQTQGTNLGLLHCRQILCCLSHRESPMLKYIDLDLLWEALWFPHGLSQTFLPGPLSSIFRTVTYHVIVVSLLLSCSGYELLLGILSTQHSRVSKILWQNWKELCEMSLWGRQNETTSPLVPGPACLEAWKFPDECFPVLQKSLSVSRSPCSPLLVSGHIWLLVHIA